MVITVVYRANDLIILRARVAPCLYLRLAGRQFLLCIRIRWREERPTHCWIRRKTPMKSKLVAPLSLAAAVASLFFFRVEMVSSQLSTVSTAQDTGVRGGAAGAGGAIAGLSKTETAFFTANRDTF